MDKWSLIEIFVASNFILFIYATIQIKPNNFAFFFWLTVCSGLNSLLNYQHLETSISIQLSSRSLIIVMQRY